MKNKIIFRKAKLSDLKNFEIIRQEKLNKLHISRLKAQKEGKGYYVICFLGKKPIGHVLIYYRGEYKWHECPAIVDLYVKESEREKGIATKLMKYAENIIKKEGYNKICLDVGISEKLLKKFYEKLGYAKVSGPYIMKYFLEDKNKTITEKINYFEKEI
mgnify:CR=1 FL=1